MADSRQVNSSIIKDAFSYLKASEESIILDGMIRFMKRAMDFALSSHDDHHGLHSEFDDDYAWAVLQGRMVVACGAKQGGRNPMGAEAAIRQFAPSIAGSGWTGVLMAGMNPPEWFSVDYEMSILHTTAMMTESEFTSYFRPI